MTYAPIPYPQGDGSKYQWSNCTLASGTDLMDRATVGRIRVPASKLRTISGDTSGGLLISQVVETVKKATGGAVVLEGRYNLTRSQVHALVAAGRAIGIIIDCSVTRYTAYRTNTFTGYHMVFANSVRYDASQARTEYRIDDPGTTSAGYMDWPAGLLYRAAEKAGGGNIDVMVARDTEGVGRVCIEATYPRTQPSFTSTRKATRTVVGTTYTVLDTTKGKGWARPDGGTGYGWHRIKWGTGSAYIKGEALR